MRLIPGKTKVRVELFKGIGLGDLIVGAISAGLVVLVATSTLKGRFYIIVALVFVAVALLMRIDTDPNYIYLLHILRHLGYRRNYKRTFDDAKLQQMQQDGRAETAFREFYGQNGQQSEDGTNGTAVKPPEKLETPEERRERKKKERKERRADDKTLKSRNASEEEKNAIWRKRAERDIARKQKKAEENADKVNAYNIADVIPFTDVKDGFIHYGSRYFGVVIEIPPVEFRFFSAMRRNNSIENSLGAVLRSVPGEYGANIVKVERPVMYENYLENEYDKLDALRKSYESGMISEQELQARVEILYDRINDLRSLCYDNKVLQPYYYLVLFDSDRRQLAIQAEMAIDQLKNGEMKPRRLNNKELAVFLKYTNQIDFDEHDIDKVMPEDYAAWAMPQSVLVRPRNTAINHILVHNQRIVGYPTLVGDAWLASAMSMPATKVVVKCTPIERAVAVRSIDRSMSELRAQFVATGVDSKRVELKEHIDTLAVLLRMLQGDSENLMQVNVYVSSYDIAATREYGGPQPPATWRANISNMRRIVRRTYQENELQLNNLEFDQLNGFIGSQVSAYDPLAKYGRSMPTNSIAAMFPWIYAHVSDPTGIRLGTSGGVPVFIDFFRRDSERVNSNMVIVGKSGSGKSYATKSLLANLAADDSKIFILDPENENSELADNLHGKFINVGNAQFGRLNPFHIITALDDEDSDGGGSSGSYATHLQFLEEFFRQILSDCEKDALEYLNTMVDRMYINHGISSETDLSKLRPEDYPTFDDLYDSILSEFQSTDNEYIRTMLRTLMNYVSKFSAGGRNANIWDGPSTVTTDENFTVFNFQSLLANRNGAVANAQMLLVLKYIDNEIIKNRDYNTRFGLHRKVVVVIDEAHVFIDTKFPVALDFMFQLAKRIRKYNGMQIVVTQNIKDFVGSEEIARKSTAIINACQYSFIFALSPNDMEDLCTLYDKAGGINPSEQEQIIGAQRGQAFTIMSPQSRSIFKVTVPKDVVSMFEERGFVSNYFSGEEGAKNWEDFVAASREIHEQNATKRLSERIESVQGVNKKRVTFREVSETELQEAVNREVTERKRSMSVMPKTVAAAPVKDSFPEIPELPEDPEAFSRMMQQGGVMPAAAAMPAANVQAAAAVPASAPVVVQATTSSETEKLLGELLGKFSYESMVNEIRRSVQEELSRGGVMPAAGAAAAASVGAGISDSGEGEESGGALGSIFNADAMAEAAALDEAKTEGPEPDEDADSFDIMALLAEESKRLGDVSPIDMMITYDEYIIDITLEELIAYNNKNQ